MCAISSRYHRNKSNIYSAALDYAVHTATANLGQKPKTIELVQAFILMSLYCVPAHTLEKSQSRTYANLAIQVAKELCLDIPPKKKPRSKVQEREMLNRTRVWSLCVTLDKYTAAHSGRPTIIKDDTSVLTSIYTSAHTLTTKP